MLCDGSCWAICNSPLGRGELHGCEVCADYRCARTHLSATHGVGRQAGLYKRVNTFHGCEAFFFFFLFFFYKREAFLIVRISEEETVEK